MNIEEKIKKLKAALNSSATPEALKPRIQKQIDELEKEIQDSKKAKSTKAKAEKKGYGQMTDQEFAFTPLGNVVNLANKAWDKTGASSGSEIRENEDKLKIYAETLEGLLKDNKVSKSAFGVAEMDHLENINEHLLNEFLIWNGYFEKEVANPQKEMYSKLFSEGKKSSTSNPKIITVSSKPKSGKVYAISIEILWAEGSQEVYDKFPKTYSTFAEANQALIPVFEDVYADRDDGGYNKVGFKINFEDGEEYEGRLYINKKMDNPTADENTIGTHVQNWIKMGMSGDIPYDKTPKEEYEKFLETYSLQDKETLPAPKKRAAVKKSKTVKANAKKYYAHRDIKYVTIIEDGEKVVYAGKDVLDGIHYLKKGGLLKNISTYVPIRDVVEVELADGTKMKPINGFHIKDAAKPVSKTETDTKAKKYIVDYYDTISKRVYDTEENVFKKDVSEVIEYIKNSGKTEEYDYIEIETMQGVIGSVFNGVFYKDVRKKNPNFETLKYLPPTKKFEKGGILKKGDKVKHYQGKLNGEVVDVIPWNDLEDEIVVQFEDGKVVKEGSLSLEKIVPLKANMTANPNSKLSETEWKAKHHIYEEGGPLVAGDDDFDLQEFLNDVYPKVSEKFAENGVSIDKDYCITHKGKKLTPTYLFFAVDQKPNSLTIGYFDDNKIIYGEFGSIVFELPEKEFHLHFPSLKIKEVSLYAKGGWTTERRYVNHSQDYEVRYAKGKNRKGYKKFSGGGQLSESDLINHLESLDAEKFGSDYAFIMSDDYDRSIFRASDSDARKVMNEKLAKYILDSEDKNVYLREVGYKSKAKPKTSVDLFEFYDQQPAELAEIVDSYSDKFNDGEMDYADMEAFKKEVEAIGYTFDYGLSNEPTGLRPIGTVLEESDIYSDGGDLSLSGFENWKNSPNYQSTIRELNDKDIDYLNWSDIDIYKWYIKNEEESEEFAAGGMVWENNPQKKVKGIYKVKANNFEGFVEIVNFEKYNDTDYAIYQPSSTDDRIGPKNVISFRVPSNRLNKINKGETITVADKEGNQAKIQRVADLGTKGYFDKGGKVGRLAKGKTLAEIAKMHGVTEQYIEKQLNRGRKVELEHTTDETIASAIAKDHLFENPDYYILLAKMEKKANPKPITEPKPTTKAKKEGNPIFAYAKSIRKPGEPWRKCLQRAKVEMKNQ